MSIFANRNSRRSRSKRQTRDRLIRLLETARLIAVDLSGNATMGTPGKRKLKLERLDSRRVLASITGTVFEDVDLSLTWQPDQGESALEHRIVYVDQNANGTLDSGEPISVTDDQGRFQFNDLDPGNYQIALFGSTTTQFPTTPVAPEFGDFITGLDNPIAWIDTTTILQSDSIALLDGNGVIETIPFGENLSKATVLADGRIVVLGQTDVGESTAFIVDRGDGSVTLLELSSENAQSTWRDLSVDPTGSGFLVNDSGGGSLVQPIDIVGSQINVASIGWNVPDQSTVDTSVDGLRTVVSSPTPNGLEVSIYSNSTGTPISPTPTTLTQTTSVAFFDDSEGILAMRTEGGGITVFDANANFAPLYSVPDVGPVRLDASTGRLFAFSPQSSVLQVHDFNRGIEVGRIAMDLSSIGAVTSILEGETSQSLLILGANGLVEAKLNQRTAIDIEINDAAQIDDVLFGVGINLGNNPPTLSTPIDYLVSEDGTLVDQSPGLTENVIDAQNDPFIVVPETAPQFGTLEVTVDGELRYIPTENYYGADEFGIRFYDGESASVVHTVQVSVQSVPDAPESIQFDPAPINEDITPGTIVGTFVVEDPDGFNHQVNVDDPRFDYSDGNIVFGTGSVDYENEPQIQVVLTVVDNETGDRLTATRTITVDNSNEPISDILLGNHSVPENAPGAVVGGVTIVDPDLSQTHIVTTDDSRFEVANGTLSLVDGVALDYESEPFVDLMLTARENGGNNVLSRSFRISVTNVPERPSNIGLTSPSIVEWLPGGTVGELLLDGQTPDPRFDFIVNDPRFVIDEGTLSLGEDYFVDGGSEPVITINVTATDSQGEFDPVTLPLTISVQPNDYPSHNLENPYDVDGSDHVSPLDVLWIINHINENGAGPVTIDSLGGFYDVNGDGYITPLDALLIINEINRQQEQEEVVIGPGGGDDGGSGGEAEGEGVPSTGTGDGVDPITGSHGGGLQLGSGEGEGEGEPSPIGSRSVTAASDQYFDSLDDDDDEEDDQIPLDFIGPRLGV